MIVSLNFDVNGNSKFCFHSNIFGWETLVVIRAQEIVEVSKQNTVLVVRTCLAFPGDEQTQTDVLMTMHLTMLSSLFCPPYKIPNAISIGTETGKFWFASFMYRDQS